MADVAEPPPVLAADDKPQDISADEIALYDRQIRLWGMQAQEKIRNANILLVTLKGLGTEIAKNLVLGGIASLTVVDTSSVTEEDLGAQYFVTKDDVGKPRAEAAQAGIQKLNSRVKVEVSKADLFSGDPTVFAPFNLVIATDLPVNLLSLLNAACRLSKKPFYGAGSQGMYGFIFADLLDKHTFSITRDRTNKTIAPDTPETATRRIVSVIHKKEGEKEVELVTKTEAYQPFILANSAPLPPDYLNNARRLRSVSPLLPCFRALWEFEQIQGRLPALTMQDLTNFTTLATNKSRELQLPMDLLKADFLRSFLQNLGSELSPVASMLGGLLAQDVINVLGGKEQPIQNLLLYDGDSSLAPVYALYPLLTTDDAPPM